MRVDVKSNATTRFTDEMLEGLGSNVVRSFTNGTDEVAMGAAHQVVHGRVAT
jgi:hypothetical protein